METSKLDAARLRLAKILRRLRGNPDIVIDPATSKDDVERARELVRERDRDRSRDER